jgi:beta-mannosidase
MHVVWHGTQEKYQIFDTLGGRFNSEFGMEAFPHIDTIKYYCTDPSQLYPQSHMLDFHNKADGHERRIATYLVENFRTKTDLEVCAVRRLPGSWSATRPSGPQYSRYRD